MTIPMIVAMAVEKNGDDQRDPCSVHRAAEDVAAELVDPEDVAELGPVGVPKMSRAFYRARPVRARRRS